MKCTEIIKNIYIYVHKQYRKFYLIIYMKLNYFQNNYILYEYYVRNY